MRSASDFVGVYRKLTSDPDLFRGGKNKDVLFVDLALHFLTQYLPGEPVGIIPFLLSGYAKVIKDDSQFRRAVQNLRHYCSSFASAYAWAAAIEAHSDIPEINRAYRVDAGFPKRRDAASDTVLDLLETTLQNCAPHTLRKMSIAKPGEARVYVDHRKTALHYRIPFRKEDQSQLRRYDLIRRSHNPPIAVRWSALMEVAREVDRVESSENWTALTGLKPSNLESRMQKIKLHAVDERLFRDGILTLEGVRHLVGMLSSGKSGLVLALLFTLARREYGKRILVLSSDTTAAAMLSARLKAHGINSTVLSSFLRRDEHLSSIHWHQAMTAGNGWSMAGTGHLIRDFSVACPLDGHQLELDAVTGVDRGEIRFPLMEEKPCHSIEQAGDSSRPTDEGDNEIENPRISRRSCPLFSSCPAQSQQRTAVDAQIVVMTAPAFLMMNPDPNVLSESMSFPELAQFDRDLVIIDEADSIQRVFDERFSLQAPIMGGEGSYLPQSSLSLHAAVQEQGGAQYASRLNVAWQTRLSRLGIAVSGFYSLLLNRWHDMSGFKLESEFTAATILCQLWKTRADYARGVRDSQLVGETEVGFQRILKMVGKLEIIDEPDPFSRQEEEISNLEADDYDPSTVSLVELRTGLRNGVDWRALIDRAAVMLDGTLRDFNTFELETREARRFKAKERNALAILSALYADIVLSDFNFLVRNQPSVSAAYRLEDYTLLNETRQLLRHYRTLVPESPNGNVFGLVYEHTQNSSVARGDLKVVCNVGVGRYLLTHLHSLLQDENQAGPHVLLLSGTSWAGGEMVVDGETNVPSQSGVIPSLPKSLKSVSIASPSYDVQVPVAGYLEQPDKEREELKKSILELMPVPDEDGTAIAVSGTRPEVRRIKLKRIAEHLVGSTGLNTRIEMHWLKNEQVWGHERMVDRRRALLVVQSYPDAIVVANAIRRQIDIGTAPHHHVYVLVKDKDVRTTGVKDLQSRAAVGVVPLPRSLVEDFGASPEGSVLVVPLVLISRGHNILNLNGVAAISSIYFLHRPHPRPDDRSGTVGQVNRFALDCLNGKVSEVVASPNATRGRVLRSLARMIARRSLAARGGYSTMPVEEQARFAWDLLTPIWQTIGRGIRGGVPVYTAFIDAKFSPGHFEGVRETPDGSCLMKVLEVLRDATDSRMNGDWLTAQKLYGPIYECLDRMFQGMRSANPIPEEEALAAVSGT